MYGSSFVFGEMLLWYFVVCRWLPKSIHNANIAPWFSFSYIVFNIHNKHVRYHSRIFVYNVLVARVASGIHDDQNRHTANSDMNRLTDLYIYVSRLPSLESSVITT